MSLKNQVLNGAIWTYGQQFGTQAIQFGVSIILARLITPSDFGLIGMITIFIGLGSAVYEGGLTNSLIRSATLEEDDYSTVFIFNVLISVFVYLIIFFSAPYIADFYKQPILKNIIRIYSLSFIINSFSAVHNTRLIKAMQFKKIAIISLPSLIVYSVIAVFMAYNNFGVWSLVFSFIASSTLSTISLWYFTDWRPKLIFNKLKFTTHFGYGNKLMMSSILDIIFTNLYNIVIGKVYSPKLLGYYTRSNSLMMLPVLNISSTLNKVAFPTFSQMQDDDHRLKSSYKRIMLLVLFLVTPVMVIMMVMAAPLVEFLFTEKWLPIVPIFQILCLTGILYPLHVYNLLILQVKGKSDLYLYLEIAKKILAVLILAISFYFDFYGLLWGQVVASVLCLGINTHYAGKFLNYNLFQQLRDILPIFLVSFLMGLLLYWVDVSFFQAYDDFTRLLFSTIIGVIFYSLLSILFKFSSFQEIKNIILKK
ncbi:lipopolysaccharide biosynthesis protein [Chryseobacterium sp. PBS4-4]|uniref:Lipopolysaccharide biosynthesis protein n=1 Tax=Chryseobacterium edaphi TaxID=2976532 RepID=A0ABT2W9R8_9FLAO|nr:lipopolysaccharide biosynthesis protein [Chryseobacterium edaphi]MCU7618713.1 lipopolysaccharide biosynthesis protein [Chryseobacterium edaphi]